MTTCSMMDDIRRLAVMFLVAGLGMCRAGDVAAAAEDADPAAPVTIEQPAPSTQSTTVTAVATASVVATNAPALVEEETPAPLPAAAEPTIVTSEQLNVDYQKKVGTFEGNVLVIDPRITVRADKMIVRFGAATAAADADAAATDQASQTLEKIEASGGVVITQADRKAESDLAVYTAGDGKVVLTGNPRVETPDGTVTGSRITFWRDNQRMDVEQGTRVIFYPDELRQKKAADPAPPVEDPAPAATGKDEDQP